MRMENGHLLQRKTGTYRRKRGTYQNKRGTYQRCKKGKGHLEKKIIGALFKVPKGPFLCKKCHVRATIESLTTSQYIIKSSSTIELLYPPKIFYTTDGIYHSTEIPYNILYHISYPFTVEIPYTIQPP